MPAEDPAPAGATDPPAPPASVGRVGEAPDDDGAPGPASVLRPLEPSATATSAGGVTVACYDLGGKGPDLLLAHATGLCGAVLAPMAAHLRSHFRCAALDLRGHGRSERPAGGNYDWHGFGADVLAVVDRLGLQRPRGFGHSCGGAALLLAEEARPGTFAGLYCFEPVVYPGDEPLAPSFDSNPLAAGSLRRRETFGSRREALANFVDKPPFDRVDRAALAAYVDNGFAPLAGGGIGLRCRREDEAQVFAHAFAHDAFARLGLVHGPVTLACGGDTDAFGPSLLAAYARRLTRSTTVVVRGVGHFGPLEDPVAVAASVTEHLVHVDDTPPA